MSCEFRFDNFVEELGLTIEAWDEMIKTGQVPKPDSNTLQTPQILEDVHPFTSTVEQSPPVGRKPTDEMNSSLIQDVESSTVEQSPPVANKPDDVMDSSLIQAAVPTHSTSKDSLSCETCGKSFSRKDALKRHQKICGNTDSKTFSCTHCSKAFSRKEHLENHLKTHEKNQNENSSTSNLNCSVCEKTFSKQANLKRHLLSHDVEKKSFKCPLCNIEFTRADNLTVHLRSHVNLNYPCTTCHAKFNSKFNLKQHMQSQHTSLSHESRKRKVSVKNSSSKKQKTYAEALNVFSSTFLTPNEDERFDIDVLVEKRGADLRRMIEDKLETHRGVKWQILAKCLFERKTPEGELQAISTYFRSSNYTELTNDTINEHIYEAFEKIKKLIDEFVNLGSGWIFQRIQHIEVKIADYHPLAPSSHIKSPDFIEKKRAVLNIENYNDSKCLIWCLIAHQLKLDFKQHPERLSHYTPLEHTIKLEKISCPVPVKSIPKIENLNNLRINVFGLDDQEVYPLYVSPKEDADVINLLVLEKDEQFHYTLIRSFSRLLGNVTKHRTAAYYCYRCLHRFCRQDLLTSHTDFCKHHSAQRINLPKFGEHILSFTGTHLQHQIPFIVYADFESILKPMTPASQTSHCEKISKHEACSFAFVIIDSEGKPYKNRFTLYRGENAAEEFLKKLISETDDIREKLQSVKPMQLSPQQEIEFKSATHCHICKRELFKKRTRDHDHVTGAYRGAAHVGCNINYKQSRSIPVVFHNLRHYDAHHIMMSIGKFKEYSIEVIASTLETYIGFRLVKENCPIHLNFIDSLQHLSASLEKLTNNLQQDEFKILKHHFKNQDISLLTRKGVYPYDYITDAMKFDETALPPASAFTNTLTDEPIKNEDYQHALNVWKTFNLQTLGDYHDLYLKTDVLLLADAFQSYRKLCQQFYDIDSAHMYTLPSLAWQACLKRTNIQLELLTDIDMLLMFENGIRGGISMISQRYAKANIPNTPAYNEDQAPSYIMYWDANNLYGWAMSEYLPHGSFQWEDPKKFTSNSILELVDDSSTGYIFEVDLDYPKELHALHNEYPLAPERLTVEEEMLSPFAKKMLENRKIKDTSKLISNLEDKKNKKLENRKFKGTPKLIPNLQNKKNYIVHYRTLKFYIQSGMILTQIHRVIQFEQSPWIREYIAFNTEKRKQAKSEFEKDFFKLLNNAVYGKTLENLRKRRNVELCNTERRAKKLVASPAFKTFKIFSEDLVAVERTKLSLLINRPLYVGFCILELSKLLMYQFHYGFVKETYQQNARLLFTDTDSLCYQIFTKDIIADMQEKKDLFDFSDYPQSHPLFSTVNKKVLGKFTDELKGELALEFVGLKAKMYSLLSETEEKKRAKGVTTHIVRKKLKHEDYLECLQELKTSTVTQVRIGQENHQLYTMQQNKVGLSPFDDKRYILEDGITSLAYGHCDIENM